MTPDPMNGGSGRVGISREEAQTWSSFLSLAARSPAFADAVVRLLDTDLLLRRQHLALYLRGRACLCQQLEREQRRQHRQARAARVWQTVRSHLAGPIRAALTGRLADRAASGAHAAPTAAALNPGGPTNPLADRLEPLLSGSLQTLEASDAADGTVGAPTAPAGRPAHGPVPTDPSASLVH